MFKLVFGYKYHKFYQSIESGLLTIFSFFNLGAFILFFSDLHIQKGAKSYKAWQLDASSCWVGHRIDVKIFTQTGSLECETN